MKKEKTLLPMLVACFVAFTSCGQNEATSTQVVEVSTEEAATNNDAYAEPHQYGGWYCPDNLRNFPPMDIQDLDKIKVVADRLPTFEETRNGTSLMYFDTAKIPNARPLLISLPRVARIYSEHSGFNELIIVIQAVIAGTDTVVGFRYPNGGNGSAWYGQLSFLSEEEVSNLGPAPMIHLESKINASKEKVWEAFIRTSYAKELAERFDEHAFFESAWTPDSQLHLSLESDSLRAKGIITSLWGMLYLQIDYDRMGFHYSEKMTLMENEDRQSSLHFVAGPYPKKTELQKVAWEIWIDDVKKVSEGLGVRF
ncbi:MAG: hypothetical protein K9J17_14665 [Flavobacteriales bacterium]|nr:hypothetical protein [Flavobacteriales bacterium]